MKDSTKSALLGAAEEVLGLPQDEMENSFDLDLFENNLIDSLGCVAMVTSVSEILNKDIDIEKLSPEDYATLNTLGEAIERIIG